MKPPVHLDPVQAYDRIARQFGAVSAQRQAYLDGIDRLIVAEVVPGSSSLLDVGAGSGQRAARIAEACGIDDRVLLEPSAAMRKQWHPGTYGWPIRAEELGAKRGSFDVVLCLWNVLGHIFPERARIAVLRECGRLLAEHGRMFIDVNHRYNAAHYGKAATILRRLRDVLQPSVRNGDVIVRWEFGDTACATDGHVFTDAEFRRLCDAAGLAVEKQFTVSYATGEVCESPFAGNPLYVIRRV